MHDRQYHRTRKVFSLLKARNSGKKLGTKVQVHSWLLRSAAKHLIRTEPKVKEFLQLREKLKERGSNKGGVLAKRLRELRTELKKEYGDIINLI